MGLRIEAGKQYFTREGKRVRIYATDGGGTYPVHGAILYESEGWCAMTWHADGSFQLVPVAADIVSEDDWREEIPWDHIHPDIKWIARSSGDKTFYGFRARPYADPDGKMWLCTGPWIGLGGVAGMPKGPEDWRDTLAARP